MEKLSDSIFFDETYIGKGNFGTVYAAFDTNMTDKLIAIKKVNFENRTKEEKKLLSQAISREVSVLSCLKHKNIVELYDFHQHKTNMYFYMEYCNYGDLSDYITLNKTIDENIALYFISAIISAMLLAQEKKVIHRDLKPANILLHKDKNGCIIPKIGDFGLSKVCDEDSSIATKQTFNQGTPYYMAPQIYEKNVYSNKCDVWSCGIILYEMLFGNKPWFGKNQVQLFQNITSLKLEFDDVIKISKPTKKLIKGMLQINEEKRMSWELAREYVDNNFHAIKILQIKKGMKNFRNYFDLKMGLNLILSSFMKLLAKNRSLLLIKEKDYFQIIFLIKKFQMYSLSKLMKIYKNKNKRFSFENFNDNLIEELENIIDFETKTFLELSKNLLIIKNIFSEDFLILLNTFYERLEPFFWLKYFHLLSSDNRMNKIENIANETSNEEINKINKIFQNICNKKKLQGFKSYQHGKDYQEFFKDFLK